MSGTCPPSEKPVLGYLGRSWDIAKTAQVLLAPVGGSLFSKKTNIRILAVVQDIPRRVFHWACPPTYQAIKPEWRIFPIKWDVPRMALAATLALSDVPNDVTNTSVARRAAVNTLNFNSSEWIRTSSITADTFVGLRKDFTPPTGKALIAPPVEALTTKAFGQPRAAFGHTLNSADTLVTDSSCRPLTTPPGQWPKTSERSGFSIQATPSLPSNVHHVHLRLPHTAPDGSGRMSCRRAYPHHGGRRLHAIINGVPIGSGSNWQVAQHYTVNFAAGSTEIVFAVLATNVAPSAATTAALIVAAEINMVPTGRTNYTAGIGIFRVEMEDPATLSTFLSGLLFSLLAVYVLFSITQIRSRSVGSHLEYPRAGEESRRKCEEYKDYSARERRRKWVCSAGRRGVGSCRARPGESRRLQPGAACVRNCCGTWIEGRPKESRGN
ncbi:hypothetical protein B0H13DRAFT_1883122 [Mycena leptocephala]|nr:hypothetical protein B0H13DRAFT_1883122 [Mycena leptocephala]